MEIERKFLIHPDDLPPALDRYPHKVYTQAYLSTDPVLRIRREGDDYVVTYKSSGLLSREEYNLPLTKEAFFHLLPKTDGITIQKTRYRIPEKDDLTIELDIFDAPFSPLILAEVEFASIEEANAYTPPAWFNREVTMDGTFHNSNLSEKGLPEIVYSNNNHRSFK